MIDSLQVNCNTIVSVIVHDGVKFVLHRFIQQKPTEDITIPTMACNEQMSGWDKNFFSNISL